MRFRWNGPFFNDTFITFSKRLRQHLNESFRRNGPQKGAPMNCAHPCAVHLPARTGANLRFADQLDERSHSTTLPACKGRRRANLPSSVHLPLLRPVDQRLTDSSAPSPERWGGRGPFMQVTIAFQLNGYTEVESEGGQTDPKSGRHGKRPRSGNVSVCVCEGFVGFVGNCHNRRLKSWGAL